MLSGDQIKRIRLSRGLSQQQIADYCKVSKDYISKVEHFRLIPSEEVYTKMIKAIYTLDDRSKEVKKVKQKEVE